MLLVEHTFPHAPQFWVSLIMSTHTIMYSEPASGLHSVNPDAQIEPASGTGGSAPRGVTHPASTAETKRNEARHNANNRIISSPIWADRGC